VSPLGSHSTSNTPPRAGSLRSIGSLALLVSALGVLLAAGLLLLPASASALTYESQGIFGAANQPSFLKAEGLAVDQSNGDLLAIDAPAGTVSRWNPDGTAANFAALTSTNVIDGHAGEADATPQNGLTFGGPSEVQVAVDNSGGETDGNIYVTDEFDKVIDIFSEEGAYLGQLTKYKAGEHGEGSETAFSAPCGVAVDPDGNVYVGDYPSQVHKYEPAGPVPGTADNTLNFAATEPCTLAAGAGPSAGSAFVATFGGAVKKFDGSSGEPKYTVSPEINTTVTVNPASGNLFVAKGLKVLEYDASGPSAPSAPDSEITVGSKVFGIAVDEETGTVYVAREGATQIEVWAPLLTPEAVTGEANPVGLSSATLHGEVNPNGLPLETCFFRYGETKSYGEIAPCEEPDAAEVGEGLAFVSVHADVEGLEGGTIYHFCLVAENANGPSNCEDETLKTPGPQIRNEAASQVSAGGARITGEVNPNGEATSFVVQYVSDQKFNLTEYAEATTVPLSPKAVGSGSSLVEVSQQLSNLAPDTAYHFRIVASNAAATNQGPDRTFTTLAEAPPALPDGRAYEMVSPPQKAGEVFPPEPGGEIGGSCAVECLPGSSLPMAPMQARPDGEEVLYVGQAFSAGLASGVDQYLGSRGPGGWETEGLSSALFEYQENQGYKAASEDLSRSLIYQISPALSADAPSSEGKSYANLYLREGGALEPLVAQAPPHRTPGVIPTETRFEIAFGGANAGSGLVAPFSHIVFAANDALSGATAFAPAAPEIEAGQQCKFFGADCNLYEWAEGELRLVNVLPGKTAAPRAVIGSRSSKEEPPAVDHAISDDGSRIFWSDAAGQVFVRIDGEETREVEAPGRFLTANPEGTKVLLGGGCLYDLEAEPAQACEDLSEGEGGFQGILGASEDLARIYFVDTAELSEEENENGEEAEEGEPNLYLWQEGDLTYIGTLLGVDNASSGIGDWQPSAARRTAQVSPDGGFLAFRSKAELTGYDNTVSGASRCKKQGDNSPLCNEVFEYEAEAGELICVSCNPSGQRPIGESNLSIIKETVAIAAAPFPAPHNLTTAGQGRIFFESQDSLTPRDTNAGVQDVYEWEPDGVGSCERPGGCVYLVSSGGALDDSMFLASTPSGDDAFLITREQLVLVDRNDQLDLYDARVGGGIPSETEALRAECQGEACQPAAAAPNDPTPSSSSFNGAGNVNEKPKHKHHRKKHKRKRHVHKRAAKHHRGGAK
jgi:hypothetical protein